MAKPRPDSLALASVPRYTPAIVQQCEGFHTIREMMEERLNPMMNQVSIGLFRMPPDEGGELVIEATAVILGCVPEAVSKFRDKSTDEDWIAMDTFLNTMQMNVLALQNAAMEGDADQTVHWYNHVKQSCAGCHARTWKDR